MGSWARLLLLGAIWGSSFMLMRIAAPLFGTAGLSALRVSIAATGLAVMLLASRTPFEFHGLFRTSLWLGITNSALPFTLFAYAAHRLPAGYSAILNSLSPLMAMLVGAIGYGGRLDRRSMLGIACGIAGVWLLTHSGPIDIDHDALLGIAACVGATVCYGLSAQMTERVLQGRAADRRPDSRIMALGSQVGAMLLLLPLFAATQAGVRAQADDPSLLQPSTWSSLSWPSLLAWLHADNHGTAVAAVIVLGLLCTSIAYALYFRLLEDIGAVGATTVTFLVPLFGVLWGWLLLDESLSWAHAGGGALIGFALWFAIGARRPAYSRSAGAGQALRTHELRAPVDAREPAHRRR